MFKFQADQQLHVWKKVYEFGRCVPFTRMNLITRMDIYLCPGKLFISFLKTDWPRLRTDYDLFENLVVQ